MLKHDALPVVFDEAEGEDRKAQDRMGDVLGLMRSASTSDGGVIGKGSSGGRANTYIIRSCFAFASIAIQLTHQSDRTRVTILSLQKANKSEDRDKRWKSLLKKYQDTITEDFGDRLRTRTVEMLPTILKNAATFSTAAAAELGQQRAGDQIGVLLAGAYSLRSSKEITYKQALEWIQARNWNEERSQEHSRDELALINHILSQVTRIEKLAGGVEERSIGELVRIAAGMIQDPLFAKDQANDRLRRLGMKVAGIHLIVGNSVVAINQYLSGTHWAKNYNKILQRLDGATDCDPTTFASGMKVRATRIPLTTLFANDQGSLFYATSETVAEATGDPSKGIITGNQDDKPVF
jgi:putative DNA primase/helicase